MIKTLKQTISNMFYWIKNKLIRLKKWLILIIFGASVVAAPLVLPNVPDVALEKIQQKYEASELKGKYRLEKTAFILDAIDENAIQAEVGNKNSDEFLPELTLRKWDDEVNFKVKYKNDEKKPKVDLEDNKIKWKGDKTEVHYYEMKKGEVLLGEELEHDVFEVEVILLEKPDTNIVEFDIETKGLAFYYQPELTQEEIDDGAFRPENVIGSYAVYHESKAGDYSKMGKKNYRAGKAFHIYRPKIIDSAGTEVWGELNITDNLLTVEIPQEFLDNAVYPVRHAAGLTFGWTGEGGSQGCGNTYTSAPLWDNATGAAGTGDSISAYLNKDTGNTIYAQYHLYDASLNKVTNGITGENTNISSTKSWVTLNFTSTPTLTAQTYNIAVWTNASGGPGGNLCVWYDTDSGNDYWNESGHSYNTWPNSVSVETTYSDVRFSIYCTYQAGAAARRMFIVD